VKTKFGEYVYNKCLECFQVLPLASVIAGSVYTTPGGLFRSIRIVRGGQINWLSITGCLLGSTELILTVTDIPIFLSV
jgi:hypothetical protein